MAKLLLVEDDESLGFVIKDNLEEAGFEVVWAKSGDKAIEKINEASFDLAILDVMLPGVDGFGVFEFIKSKNYSYPVIFMTAKSLNEDRIFGLKMGADDYISKPFAMEELILRVGVILKRVGVSAKNDSIKIGQYTLEPNNLKLINGEITQNLTIREVDLLKLLFLNKNNTVPRDQILINLWGENDYFKGRSLDVFITRLRKCLVADTNLKLTNIHGVGFKLEVLK